MKECCNTCARQMKLEKLDYSKGGCVHTMQEGYACLLFVDEGIVNWMVGGSGEGVCEEYRPRKEKT